MTQLAGRDVVLVHSSRDRITSPQATQSLTTRARRAGARTCMVTVRGGDHAMIRRAPAWHRLTTTLVTGLLGTGSLPEPVTAALGLPPTAEPTEGTLDLDRLRPAGARPDSSRAPDSGRAPGVRAPGAGAPRGGWAAPLRMRCRVRPLTMEVRRPIYGGGDPLQAEACGDGMPSSFDPATVAALLDGNPAGVAVLDANLRYTYVNPALERLNGLRAGSHLGRTFSEVLPELRGQAAVLRNVLRDGRPREQTISGRTWAAASSAPGSGAPPTTGWRPAGTCAG